MLKKKLSAFIIVCVLTGLVYGNAYADCNCNGCCTSNGGVVCRNGVTMCADGTSLSSACISQRCTAEWCSGCYDGQWSGKTDQGLEVSFDVSDNNVINMIIGFTPCGAQHGMLQKHVGPYPVENKTFSFTNSVVCNPLTPSDTISYTISGTFSNNLACKGTWRIVGGTSGTWEAENITASEPDISVSPESLSFGEKNVGSSQIQTVTITNSGGGSLNIEKISIAGTNASAFKIEKDNCSGQTLSSYTTATIELAFSPDSAGSKGATLRIASDDPATPILTITLSGAGVLVSKNLVADFGSQGLYFYDGTSWNGLLNWDAENIIGWGNKLVADFGDKGLYLYDGSLWDGLVAWNPDDMIVWENKLVVDFGERGIYLYNGSSWTGLTKWNPDKLVVWGDKLAADFGANGIYQYDGQTWKGLTGWNPEKMIEWDKSAKDSTETETDKDKDGYTANQGDCNDSNATVHPGATETCGDGIDQDCNGSDLACSGTGNIDAAAISELLSRHNYWREQVGVGTLTWSSEVAAYAQEWADHLQSQDCSLEHRTDRLYGENLAGGYGMSAQEVVDMWASEKANYDYESNTCNGVCGHYTQVVWRGTTQIGCGMATCGGKEVWVCNYNPAGNYIGMKPY